MVTLTGAGGVGKTRLALEVANAARPAFSDGVLLVDLAPLSADASVARAVLAVLGLAESPRRPVEAALLAHLRPRCLLLVLDNCEHLITACAELAEALLHTCPRIRLLVTSRQVLGTPGEAVYRVPSLGLPDPAQPLTPTRALAAEAVRLFAERATLVRPEFSLTADNVAAVVAICRPWMASPSPSNWPPRACACSVQRSSSRGWTTASRCSRAARAACCRASRRCGLPWTGAMTC